nr:RIP metalloprotease RseP [Desulfovibrio aminophilus]
MVLSGLIFFHELGHFLMARVLGIGVKAFSLGFGPRLLGRRVGLTDYRLSAVPLGGYVNLAGENPDSDEGDQEFPREKMFNLRPAWQRMLVVAAGPVFNFFLAWLIYWGLLFSYGQAALTPVVGDVLPDSPAAVAGIQAGDTILEVDGRKVATWNDLTMTIQTGGYRSMPLVLSRGGKEFSVSVEPASRDLEADGRSVKVPMIGIRASGETMVLVPPQNLWRSALGAGRETWEKTGLIVRGIAKMVRGEISVKEVGGPILIAQEVGRQARSGLAEVLALTAFISLNLGLLNLLPVPVLDGGHIVFFGYEAVFRRPVSERLRLMATRVGIAFLFLLMGLALFNDISRLLV